MNKQYDEGFNSGLGLGLFMMVIAILLAWLLTFVSDQNRTVDCSIRTDYSAEICYRIVHNDWYGYEENKE